MCFGLRSSGLCGWLGAAPPPLCPLRRGGAEAAMRRCTSAKEIDPLPKREVGSPLHASTRLPQLMCMMAKSPSGRSLCILAREGSARRRRRSARRV